MQKSNNSSELVIFQIYSHELMSIDLIGILYILLPSCDAGSHPTALSKPGKEEG